MNRRLFIGIALDKQQILQLCRLQADFDAGVRLVAPTNLHMTLAFLGPVSPRDQAALEQAVCAMSRPRFSVTLDSLVHWKKPKILCIKGQADDQALHQITSDCQAIASRLHLHHSEHLFTPHVTLARKARSLPQSLLSPLTKKTLIKPPLIAAIVIAPCAMHLFESKSGDQGVEYRILRSWDLEEALT